MEATIKRFEQMLEDGNEEYFLTETLEELVYHYIKEDQGEKGLKALELLKNRNPYRNDYLLQEATLLLICHKSEEALNLLNSEEKNHLTNGLFYDIRSRCHANMQNRELLDEDNKRAEKLGYDSLAFIHVIEDDYAIILKKKMKEMEPLELFYDERRNFNSDHDTLKAIYDVYKYSHSNTKGEGVNFFKKMVEDDSSSADRWMWLGMIYHDYDQDEEADNALAFSISLDPANSQCYYQLAHQSTMANRDEEAIAYYYLAIKHLKDNEDTLYGYDEGEKTPSNLGILYYWIGRRHHELKQYEKSIKANLKALEYDDYSIDSNACIGHSFIKLKLFDDAITYYERAMAIVGKDDGFYLSNMAYANYLAGYMDKTGELLKRAEKDPYLFELYFVINSLYLWHIGQKETALKELDEAIAGQPMFADFFYLKSAFYFWMEDEKGAVKHLNTALKLDFKSYELLFEYSPELETNPMMIKTIEDYRLIHQFD